MTKQQRRRNRECGLNTKKKFVSILGKFMNTKQNIYSLRSKIKKREKKLCKKVDPKELIYPIFTLKYSTKFKNRRNNMKKSSK